MDYPSPQIMPPMRNHRVQGRGLFLESPASYCTEGGQRFLGARISMENERLPQNKTGFQAPAYLEAGVWTLAMSSISFFMIGA